MSLRASAELVELEATPRTARAETAAAWLRQVLSEASVLGGPEAVLRDVRSVRGAPRPLVRGVVVDPTGSCREVFAKAYRDDRGARTLDLLHRLQAAGLIAPARHRVTTGLGWSAGHRALVAEAARGRPWVSFLDAPPRELVAASHAVGGWLGRLQEAGVCLPDRSCVRASEAMCQQLAELRRLHSRGTARLSGPSSVALDMLAHDQPELVPSHGDLHPHNVHLDSDVVTALDLDTAGRRRPSYDAGYAVGQLLIMAFVRFGAFRRGAQAALAFWEAWAPTGADRDAVPAQVVRTLVQSLHYELVTLANGRWELVPAWSRLAEDVVTHGVTAALEQRVTR